MRTDVSLTLFLAQPENYEGGSLVIESAAGEQEFKLAAGSPNAMLANSFDGVLLYWAQQEWLTRDM
jgi:predicted 2-oxoglutarate/Fe(II)-dependent dioxygenase YbiX